MYWSTREKDVQVDDWRIIIQGTDGEKYDYDGTTADSIASNTSLVEEMNDN